MVSPCRSVTVAFALVLAVGSVGCTKNDDATSTDTTAASSAVTSATGATSSTTVAPTTATTGSGSSSSSSSSTPSIPGPTVVAPDELGTPGPDGMQYPTPTTCAQVSALLGSGNVSPSAASALAQGSGIWLAVDAATTSADIFFQKSGSDRTLVKLRAGVVTFNGSPSAAQLPALTPMSYATAEVASDLTPTSCVEGAVVD